MKIRYILLSLLVLSLVLNGCQQVTQKETCKSPYIEYKLRECCLDSNGNSICDNDEEVKSDKVKGMEELKCNLPAGFACSDFWATTDDKISLMIRNGAGFDADITLKAENCGSSKKVRLPNGESKRFDIYCSTDLIKAYPSGIYNGKLSMTYFFPDTGLIHEYTDILNVDVVEEVFATE